MESDSHMRGLEERYASGAEGETQALYPKEAIATTFLKIDHFNDKLSAIRKQLAARHSEELRPREPFDAAKRSNNWEGVESIRPLPANDPRDYDPIRLPVLPNATQPPRASEPRFDAHVLSMDALKGRSLAQVQYEAAWQHLQRVEQDAAATVQDAERLTEDARIAMVLYAQNEKGWNFDERARRYQHVMQAKKEAEAARMKADDDRVVVQCLRAQLVDPYVGMRSKSQQRTRSLALPSLTPTVKEPEEEDCVLVWILASPLLTLPFTPRDATPGRVLAAEKELSTHVVYYAATSLVPALEELTGDETTNDKPPTDGWLCCSHHGVSPAPVVAPLKSSLETWIVSGAGAGHVNGRFIFSGIHNGTRKFKSSSGVELFRKKLPKTSSIIQGILDATGDQDAAQASLSRRESAREVTTGDQNHLPSSLQTLEQNHQDFKSMEKIGAWMSADDMKQKRRRMRDMEYSQKIERLDGDHVLIQETNSQRKGLEDVAPSRPEASAELCREWVLFMRCSRRVDPHMPRDDAARNLSIGCLKRHYYISIDEKDSMVTWAHEQEAWLEKDVLSAIIRREAHVERVMGSSSKCMALFQEGLVEEMEGTLNRMLKELNTVRFLTVKVLESIDAWRAHARKRGFTRYEADDEKASEPAALGWSASITVETGKRLFKGSKAFVSKFKRFCRPEDAHGQQERRLVYLGYFATRDEAEQAYDEFANAEARRLNTTEAHLPRRRSVFRSCGKHFAVESERLGPDYCIECKAKQLSTIGSAKATDATVVDDWNPPFYFTPGQNYILKLAHDLDFLDQILPLKSRLDATVQTPGNTLGRFPLLGNVFLLPTTPIEDPTLAFFTSLQGSGVGVPQFRGEPSNQAEEDDGPGLDEALDVERVLRAQKSFIQEMLIYHPELFAQSSLMERSNQSDEKQKDLRSEINQDPAKTRRVVMALYWDRCAALRIRQERAPLPFRQPGVWCRPDAGEWSSLLVRGKHQQHFLFETRLAKAGKEMHERRKKALKTLRKLLKTPLYLIHSREIIVRVIGEGELVKGDVVMLEVKSAHKFLDKYDSWCVQSVVIQRWYRGIRGRRRARARRRALMITCRSRRMYMECVSVVASKFYEQLVLPAAVRSTMKILQRPVCTQSVKMDGEIVVVSVHVSRSSVAGVHNSASAGEKQRHKVLRGFCCPSCARLFHVSTSFNARSTSFKVASLAVCSCTLNNPVTSPWESWVVRAYNPRNNCVYRLKIENGLLMQLLEAGKSIRPHNSTTTAARRSARWNPVTECSSLREAVRDASNFGNYVEKLASNAGEEAANWRLLSDEATQRRKMAEVELTKARQRVVDLAKQFEVAIIDARRALDFASRPFHEAQAWDPLENANDWRLLVHKRHTQKELAFAIDDADRCRFELFQATSSENFLRVRSMEARAVCETHWQVAVQQRQKDTATLAMELEIMDAVTNRAIHHLCTEQLTLRDAFLAPTRRSLVVTPAAWHRTDSAMARMLMIAIPGLERGCNTLRRRVLRLSDRNLSASKRLFHRVIVEVSSWTSVVASKAGDDKRNVWMAAYDPVTTRVQRVYLDWELVRLLATPTIIRPTAASSRSRWVSVADKLLSLCMLDRFTGEFTLEKLQFYHHLRLLRPHFLASKWFQDLKCGRKCGDGDEIFRQSAVIDGKLCFVAVLENWGDLVLRVYPPSSAKCLRLQLSIHDIFAILAQKPLALHLWICCVKSNQYVPAVVATILKHVVFIQKDGGELELMLAKSQERVTGRVVVAVTVQQRRLLVNFRDTIAGDLHIAAFDIKSNRTYQLRLEWENIRRALKENDEDVSKGTARSGASRRRRNLTLTRNRRELCEWIASRLRFQSLLEHPDVLASSSSPLVSGVQIRTSFALLNDWILNSVRNPVSPVPQSEIDEYAAAVDAMLFQGLVHEQLAFLPQAKIAYHDEKTWLETRDFISGAKGIRSDHLKVDMYVKTHQVFARVRRELQEETRARHEREESALMLKEETLAMQVELLDACAAISSDLTKCSDALGTVSQCIVSRQDQWSLLLAELVQSVAARTSNAPKKKGARKKEKNSSDTNESREIDAHAAVCRLLACVRSGGSVAFEVFMRQRFGLSGTLSMISAQIGVLLMEISDRVRVQFDAFHATVQEAADQEDVPLARLEDLRSQCAQFCVLEDSVAMPETDSISEDGDLPLDPSEHGEAEKVEDEAVHAELEREVATDHAVLVDEPPQPPLATAFLLPAKGAIEEVAFDSTMLDSGSFADTTAALSTALLPLFPRAKTGNRKASAATLRLKRVPYGWIALEQAEPRRNGTQWNARASALAMEAVAGNAVFIPREEVNMIECDVLLQSLTPPENYTSTQKPRPSSGAIAAAKRRATQRTKQLLPWKQLSVERMQTARRLRQQRARSGLLMRKLEDDYEREQATLATHRVSRRSLEWISGASDVGDTSLSAYVESLRLIESKRGEHQKLSLGLVDEHRMQRLFETEEQLTQPIASDTSNSALQLQHIQVDADDWQHPRRLVFSCRELQSRQFYVVDCLYAQLMDLSQAAGACSSLHWPRTRLPVAEWRSLARVAAQNLIFRRKNGTLSLEIKFQDVDSSTSSDEKTVVSLEANASSTNTSIAETAATTSRSLQHSTNVQFEVQLAENLSRSRRFKKLQAVARLAAVARQVNEARMVLQSRRVPLEWLRMTQEDWKAQEYRGLLVLDAKELKKLKQIFTRVYQKRLQAAATSVAVKEPTQEAIAWLVDVAAEMDAKEKAKPGEIDPATRHERHATSFLRSAEQTKWWSDKHPEEERWALDMADVAEFWRVVKTIRYDSAKETK